MGQITVFGGPERRRRWHEDERAKILSEAFSPGACVARVARQHDVSTALIYTWRRKAEVQSAAAPAQVGFVEAVVLDDGGSKQVPSPPAVVVDLPGGRRVNIGGPAPPVALCYYSSDRRGEHPRAHLAGYTGILQVDRYAGFNALFEEGWADKPMTCANCWVHARREFFKLVDIRQQLKRKKKGTAPLISPLATEALEIIDRLFAIERGINGKPAAERLAVRQELSAPIVAELEAWMHETRSKLSRHDAVAKVIAYLQNDWAGFTTFLADGRICLSNNAAERQLRSVARGRKAWLFVGSDRGGQRAAMMLSLFGTARLNDVDPLAWFTDVLARIADIPQNHLHELLPWHWKAAQQAAEELAA